MVSRSFLEEGRGEGEEKEERIKKNPSWRGEGFCLWKTRPGLVICERD